MDLVKNVVSIDPIGIIEEKMGKTVDQMTDEEQKILMSAAIAINAEKNKILNSTNDVSFSTRWNDLNSILAVNGFETVYNKMLPNNERECIWFKNGCVIYAESWHGAINSGHAFFELNLSGLNDSQYSEVLSNLNGSSYGHGYNRDDGTSRIFVNKDIRDGVIWFLNQFDQALFNQRWSQIGFFSLCNNVEEKEVFRKHMETLEFGSGDEFTYKKIKSDPRLESIARVYLDMYEQKNK